MRDFKMATKVQNVGQPIMRDLKMAAKDTKVG